ncbi:MAG: OmpA family protein [Rhodospirillales bacterium]|nr:OmpA family protein [Rhodospirillales bacterium]
MKNNQLLKVAGIVGVGLLMSACAANYDVEKVSTMKTSGDGFSQALHKHYGARAMFEAGEGDWRSVSFFNTRAMNAAGGMAPALQPLNERSLKKDADAIMAAHKHLSAAFATSAPHVSPDACALSQTWLEHWMEQAEEGHQPDDIMEARSGYEKAVPDCIGGPRMGMMPHGFIVYFDFNSAALNADGAATVARAARFLSMHSGMMSASLTGHTDRAGDNAYNDQLAAKRVEAVRAALKKAGVDTVASAVGHGENLPSVKTADGVKQAENRRVEILIGK